MSYSNSVFPQRSPKAENRHVVALFHAPFKIASRFSDGSFLARSTNGISSPLDLLSSWSLLIIFGHDVYTFSPAKCRYFVSTFNQTLLDAIFEPPRAVSLQRVPTFGYFVMTRPLSLMPIFIPSIGSLSHTRSGHNLPNQRIRPRQTAALIFVNGKTYFILTLHY